MQRSLPLLALALLIICAGCLGGLGLGDSSNNTTTTTTPASTEPTQTATSTASTTTTEPATTTTTATQTASTTTHTTTTTQPTQTTYLRTTTTARIDTPEESERFQARVTKIVDPTTVTIEHDGTNQTVDLIGVRVPDSGQIHKRARQTTDAQLAHSVVTVVTDPTIESDADGHLRAYIYTGEWLYNTQLLRTGYARVPTTDFSKRQQFLSMQQQAKQRGYGRWNTTAR